jgi:pentatricopeptide repeat protein
MKYWDVATKQVAFCGRESNLDEAVEVMGRMRVECCQTSRTVTVNSSRR